MDNSATARVFFDTNVVLYVVSDDAAKAKRSEEIIDAGGVISVQVLNEAVYALKRKFKADWQLIGEVSTSLRANLEVVPLTIEIHARGLAIAERYQLQIYDSMIVAAALGAGCTTLWSEDMQDGFVVEGLTIRNPYRIPPRT